MTIIYHAGMASHLACLNFFPCIFRKPDGQLFWCVHVCYARLLGEGACLHAVCARVVLNYTIECMRLRGACLPTKWRKCILKGGLVCTPYALRRLCFGLLKMFFNMAFVLIAYLLCTAGLLLLTSTASHQILWRALCGICCWSNW